MSISGIGSAGGFDVAKMASTIASKIVKNLDTNSDGTLEKKEFVAGLTANGVSAADAAKQFDSIDTKKTGKITQADIESAIKSSVANGAPPAEGKSGPPPGGGPTGGHATGGAGQAGGASKTSSSKTYDKMDLDQDGTVTSIEELTYELKHLNASSSDNDKTTSPKVGSNVNVKV
jgi:Ca2+-binding EF-hand superfamily protein